MLDSAALERIVQKVIDRLRALVGRGPCPLCGASGGLAPGAPPRPCAPASAPPMSVGVQAVEHPDRLLAEDELVSYYRRGVRALRLPPRCIVTPAARDRARDLGVDLLETESYA